MNYEKIANHVIAFKDPEITESDKQQIQQDMGALLLESANDKAKIKELETLTGDLIIEIANLKAGGAA
ncbi:MAG TPA: hypothetical protein VNM45_02105 [Bacillus sp. (in: firmicutes)]|nr:hypothetical protein [Bacillus sp. (in: firmicutes)]